MPCAPESCRRAGSLAESSVVALPPAERVPGEDDGMEVGIGSKTWVVGEQMLMSASTSLRAKAIKLASAGLASPSSGKVR